MKKILLFLLFVFFTCLCFSQSSPYFRVKIPSSGKDKFIRAATGIHVDYTDVEGNLILEINNEDLKILRMEDISYEVLIEDLEKYYEDRNSGKSPSDVLQHFRDSKEYEVPEDFSLGSMGGFCTYDELLCHLDSMAAKYPELITQRDTLGEVLSIEGRPIFWLKISDNPYLNEDEPETLYTALIHAREPGSMQQMLFFMYYLLENYETNNDIKNLVDNSELYFIPCINPDGYLYNEATHPNGGGMWRKNRRYNGDGTYGVDLNRNWGYMWGYDNIGSSPNPSSQTYRGTAPFSEPETSIVRDFCNEQEVQITLNYHTYSNLLLHPWGYKTEHTPDHEVFTVFGKLLTQQNNYLVGTAPVLLYRTNGDANDWMYGEQESKPKIICYTPEVGSSSDGFWPPMERIIPQCQENLLQNILAAKLSGQYAVATDQNPINIVEHEGFLKYKIQRVGLQNGNITVTLIPMGDYFTSIEPQKEYAALELLEEISDSVFYSLGPNISYGDKVEYLLKVECGSFTNIDTIRRPFGLADTLFFDYCSGMSSWISDDWGVTTEYFYSPETSITDSPGGLYQNNMNTQILLTDTIDLSNIPAAWLSFSTRWILDGGNDFVILMASSDLGETWTALKGKYTTVNVAPAHPEMPVYTGRQLNWIKEFIDLQNFCGDTVLIKFRFDSDLYAIGDGFYFDDFCIEIINPHQNVQEINLPAGWNSLSSYLIPENPAMDYLFSNFADKLVIIENMNSFFQPGNGNNTLNYWNTHSGYRIKLNEGIQLQIQGSEESLKTLTLAEGWNLLPVLLAEDVLINDLIVDPEGSIEIIKEIAGCLIYWPENEIFTLESLMQGKAYLVKMKNSGNITFY